MGDLVDSLTLSECLASCILSIISTWRALRSEVFQIADLAPVLPPLVLLLDHDLPPALRSST